MESTPAPPHARPFSDPPATFRLMVLVDLGNTTPTGPTLVDKASFGELFERIAPRVKLEVADHLGGPARTLEVELSVTSLKSFSPDGVVAAVPRLAELATLRTRLSACTDGREEAVALKAELPALLSDPGLAAALGAALEPSRPGAAAPPSREAPGGSALDSLLSKVEVPGAAVPPSAGRQLADVLAEAFAAGTAAPDRDALRTAAGELDDRLTHQVAAILACPPIRRLEAAWRGLKSLVDRLDFRAPVRLEVLSAPVDELLDAFYERVFGVEYEGESEHPLSLVVTAVDLGRSPEDLDLARAAARLGESLQVPFVLAAGPEYWGIRQPQLLASLPDLAGRCRGPEYAKWNAFRAEPTSLWITVAANRFLARPAWGEATGAVRAFSWTGAGATAEEPVWCSPVWAMAAVAGQGFAEAGVRFPLAGPTSPTVLEDLPLRAVSTRGEPVMSPVEAQLVENRVVDLADAGFAALFSSANRDAAHFRWVPTYHAPARFQDPEATRASYLEATLSYQLLAGAVAHLVHRTARTVSPSDDEASVVEAFSTALLGLLSTAEEEPQGDEVAVELGAGEDPRQREVLVRIRPRFQVEGGPIDLVLGTPLPGGGV